MEFLFFTALLYFLPSIIGHRKRDFAAIFLMNFFLGWTVIGWIAALVWACRAREKCAPTIVFAAAGMPAVYAAGSIPSAAAHYCSRCGSRALSAARFCWSCGRAI
ncbi:MAG TPA: superinfection immunity protein [Candidatus Acidoferrales bacterium]|nr:superinfection immunity protein [Candidatus Acidoferrales bacterium]